MTDAGRQAHEIAGTGAGLRTARKALYDAHRMYKDDTLVSQWLTGFAAGVFQCLTAANVPSPEIFIALSDSQAKGCSSFVVGAFSTEKRAQDACQEDAIVNPLEWRDAEAKDADGSEYAVVLVNLDIPV